MYTWKIFDISSIICSPLKNNAAKHVCLHPSGALMCSKLNCISLTPKINTKKNVKRTQNPPLRQTRALIAKHAKARPGQTAKQSTKCNNCYTIISPRLTPRCASSRVALVHVRNRNEHNKKEIASYLHNIPTRHTHRQTKSIHAHNSNVIACACLLGVYVWGCSIDGNGMC